MKSITLLMLAVSAAFFSTGYTTRSANAAFELVSRGVEFAEAVRIARNVTIAFQIGAVIGALLLWPLSALFGRKTIYIGGIGVAALGSIISISTPNISAFYISCGCAGIAIVISLIIGNLWVAENVPARSRGQYVISYNIGGAVGLATCEWINFAIAWTGSDPRIGIGLRFLFLIPAAVLLYMAPESYRWLLNHNQTEEARAILNSLDQNLPSNGSATKETYFDALVHHQQRATNTPSIFSLRPQAPQGPTKLHLHPRRRLILVFAVQTLAALCGISSANFYITRGLTNANTSLTLATRVVISLVPTLDVIFQIPPYLLISRFGVRKLLMLSALGMAFCFTVATPVASIRANSFSRLFFAGTDGQSAGEENDLNAVIIAFGILTYVCYDFGLGLVPYILMTEFTPSLQNPLSGEMDLSTAIPAITTSIRFAIDLGMMFAQASAVSMGASYLLVWLLVNLVIVVVVWAIVPETVGRGLEDMDRYFASNPLWFVGLRDKAARRVWGVQGTGSAAGRDGERGYVPGSWAGRHQYHNEEDQDEYWHGEARGRTYSAGANNVEMTSTSQRREQEQQQEYTGLPKGVAMDVRRSIY
ncbi:Sugar transporter STL1 [Cyphellophora attinorum]|uniref:Sugar transporter STL1 n=1 Tax=Cyphellophora attinorum TaxID=1664694 RepID=A0A0N0NPP3_9EURO|nr:Sugar transporter STL1 [Phialophora attinorum]KPI42779.1 Sugar transporter STL1 [Phialophora attinorum]